MEIDDDSAAHAGHYGMDAKTSETHFRVLIVSEAFQSKVFDFLLTKATRAKTQNGLCSFG